MKLSTVKNSLSQIEEVRLKLPNGSYIPQHFHVTEIGKIDKRFIDCGGTKRNESVISFQLWTSVDYDHRLSAKKLKSIIELSERELHLEDLDVEVEYQGETIGKYGLDFDGSDFLLTTKQTDCLAKDNCGIPLEKVKVSLGALTPQTSGCCTPGSTCC
ncbi:MAG: DUF6428 family protein [Bacteroidia bacterium]|nr:DUF6428 family protein [Bacteroidia bacterium]